MEVKPLRYLIGADQPEPDDTTITEVGYDCGLIKGECIAYCNAFDEKNTGRFAPYRSMSDTAKEYNEGEIDPTGQGFKKNLIEQFARRKSQGFRLVEIDNMDAYESRYVLQAVDLAQLYGFGVFAKNPGLVDGSRDYVAHKAVVGIIVEKNAGTPWEMDKLRRLAGKPLLPVYFVSFGRSKAWATQTAKDAQIFYHMGVTHSPKGEYASVQDLLIPRQAPAVKSWWRLWS